MRKALQLKVLLLVIFILIFSSYVLGACCYSKDGCSAVSSQASCPSTKTFSSQDCSQLTECDMGCCCDTNYGTRRVYCSLNYPSSQFIKNSSLSLTTTCSCTSGITVSGVVKKNGNPEAGVSVSSGSITAITKEDGSFILNGVPKGNNVVISASTSACTGSHTISSVSDDVSGLIINLACTCTIGCDIDSNSYCDDNKVNKVYNLGVDSEKREYCSYCVDQDPDCGGYNQCRPGDGSCPEGCTASRGDKYDSDCECNSEVKNGYCPGPPCTTDLDCGIVFNKVCGDGVIFYPFETCDPAQSVAQYCSVASCIDCNCVSTERCGNHVIDSGEQCELGQICSDGNPCLNCKCTESCSGTSLNPQLSARFEKSSRQVVLNWALSDSCKSLVVNGFRVMMCKRDSLRTCTNLSEYDVVGTYSNYITNVSVLVTQNSVYKFFVRALYSGSEGVSQPQTVTTGSDLCMNLGPDKPNHFCIGDNRSRCDGNNNIVTEENCKLQNKYCSGPNIWGNTTCEDADNCMLCNGLLGSFGKYLDLAIFIRNEKNFCNWEDGRMTVPGCYFEKTKFLFSSYNSCNNVMSCYDFKSQGSCTDPNDPCGINSQCEWISLPQNPSLGGICRPKDVARQDCNLCDSSRYNWFSSICTSQVCGLFGEGCNYLGENNTPRCSKSSVYRCTEYNSEEKCIAFGGSSQQVIVDAIYDSNNTRIGGTHVITKSRDERGLGKCFWSVNGCKRDADNLRATPVPGGRSYGFDCVSNDFLCESDFKEPTTNVSNYGLFRATPEITFEVSDDKYPSNMIKTYFCIASQNQVCYPSELGFNIGTRKIYSADRINTSGVYRLFYYSEDPAKNLEIVKNTTIRVDADMPYIYLISPTNESGLVSSQQNITIVARTAPDVKYVCVNNTALKKTVCVNSCSIPGVSSPCIDGGGIFSVNVPLSTSTTSSTIVRNLIFKAEDVAGNVYVNTLLGIIYDIDPPDAPIITVKARS